MCQNLQKKPVFEYIGLFVPHVWFLTTEKRVRATAATPSQHCAASWAALFHMCRSLLQVSFDICSLLLTNLRDLTNEKRVRAAATTPSQCCDAPLATPFLFLQVSLVGLFSYI